MKMTAEFKEFSREEGEVSQATQYKKKKKESKQKLTEGGNVQQKEKKKDNLTSKMHGLSSKEGKKKTQPTLVTETMK